MIIVIVEDRERLSLTVIEGNSKINNEYQLPQRNLVDFMRLRPPNYMRIETFEDMYKHITYNKDDLIERISDIVVYLDKIVSSTRDERDISFADEDIDEYNQALERYSDSLAIYNIVRPI